ncbi:MAG: ATP-binding protein [Saprospiraceae bacterium]|nr:ATP-binding protein [Saprospiraceae bacterium]
MITYSKEIIVTNEISSIEYVADQFTAHCQTDSIDPKVIIKVNVVFDELLSNIIKYSYEEEGAHPIYVDFGYDDGRLNIQIRDKGLPFNPFHVTPPDFSVPLEERTIGGLGIYLVKNLMDTYQYERINQENVVTMSKFV